MLDLLGRCWAKLRLGLAVRRQRAIARRMHAGDPVEAQLHALCVEADTRGIEALMARQRIVVCTWSARGIIGNGGFRYFLEGTRPLAPVAQGFRALGFEHAAAACERVTAAVAAAPALTEARSPRVAAERM